MSQPQGRVRIHSRLGRTDLAECEGVCPSGYHLEAALTLSRARDFASTGPEGRHLVFAPARYVSQKMLNEEGIPVEFVLLPFALYRIDQG